MVHPPKGPGPRFDDGVGVEKANVQSSVSREATYAVTAPAASIWCAMEDLGHLKGTVPQRTVTSRIPIDDFR